MIDTYASFDSLNFIDALRSKQDSFDRLTTSAFCGLARKWEAMLVNHARTHFVDLSTRLLLSDSTALQGELPTDLLTRFSIDAQEEESLLIDIAGEIQTERIVYAVILSFNRTKHNWRQGILRELTTGEEPSIEIHDLSDFYHTNEVLHNNAQHIVDNVLMRKSA